MRWVLGADEVGLGAAAGPCVVAAVLAPEGWTVEELDDSKKLCRNPKKIQRVYDRIVASKPFISYWVAWRWPHEIDSRGIRTAQISAFLETVRSGLQRDPDAEVIVDGTLRLPGIQHRSVPKADSLFPAVSAASVIAKVERDRWMREVAHPQYPDYDWINGVGYLSPSHLEALHRLGPCELHRKSWRPIAELLDR